MAFLLGSVVTLEGYMHWSKAYRWELGALMGLFYAWIGMKKRLALGQYMTVFNLGLNIQHDANHGAVSRNPTVNRALGASQNWIGGSAISWVHQHVVQHHVHTNDVNLDPDIAGKSTLNIKCELY